MLCTDFLIKRLVKGEQTFPKKLFSIKVLLSLHLTKFKQSLMILIKA